MPKKICAIFIMSSFTGSALRPLSGAFASSSRRASPRLRQVVPVRAAADGPAAASAAEAAPPAPPAAPQLTAAELLIKLDVEKKRADAAEKAIVGLKIKAERLKDALGKARAAKTLETAVSRKNTQTTPRGGLPLGPQRGGLPGSLDLRLVGRRTNRMFARWWPPTGCFRAPPFHQWGKGFARYLLRVPFFILSFFPPTQAKKKERAKKTDEDYPTLSSIASRIVISKRGLIEPVVTPGAKVTKTSGEGGRRKRRAEGAALFRADAAATRAPLLSPLPARLTG